jgi:photosystem II stability/assembly factor-like uncharacterized protein
VTPGPVLVATHAAVLVVAPTGGEVRAAAGPGSERPTALSPDPWRSGRAWCGTDRGGVFRSDDGGATWTPVGLVGERILSVSVSPARADLVRVGTEPSAVWQSEDAGEQWERLPELTRLPSSSRWAFPPRPETHHVRWIVGHPIDADRFWVAVEAGALVSTADGGGSWRDRVPGGPRDTHELSIHPALPEMLRVSAGDGYFESPDGGATWASPGEGLEVGYLRSVAIDPGDPETVLVSASTGPRTAYAAGYGDGRVYRRAGRGAWVRVTAGWPDPPTTIAPLLAAGREAGEFWAADERGLHRSGDGGTSWRQVATFDPVPAHLRGLAVLPAG